MKFTSFAKLFAGIVMCSGAWVGVASAQQLSYYTTQGATQGEVQQVSFGKKSSCSSCGCEASACGCAAPACDSACNTCGCEASACGCEAACDPCAASCCDDGCGGTCYMFGDDEPFTLFAPDASIRAAGWFQIGYHTQGANGIGTGLFNNFPNQVQLQQGYAYVEKALDLECKDVDWGFRADFVYGTDAQDTQAFGQLTGWDTPWDNGPANSYGSALPQLYGEVGMGDLTIKAGKFYTIVGYEVVTAPDNFFYSHAFTQYRAEPFTHTGVLATYAMNDWLTVYGGWTLGWDTGFDRAGGNNFLGGFSAQLFDNMAFTYVCTLGDFGFEGQSDSDTNGYSHSAVLTWDISDRLHYIFQSDYIDNDIFLGSTRDLIGANQYLIYDINDCWGIGGRLEWFDDPRMVEDVTALTCGVNWRPHANVVLRPEVRWDLYRAGGLGPDGNAAVDSTLFGIDCIVTW